MENVSQNRAPSLYLPSSTVEQWTVIGRRLAAKLTDALDDYDRVTTEPKWQLGDWLTQGETAGFVRDIQEAADLVHVPVDALMEMKLTSAAFPVNDRIPGATWQMHSDARLVAKGRELLIRCMAEGWEPFRISAALRHSRAMELKEQGIAVPEGPSYVEMGYQRKPVRRVIYLTCPHCHHQLKRGDLIPHY